MSRELDLIAKEFSKKPVTVMRSEINLYGTNIQYASAQFLREVERECKREKNGNVILIVISEHNPKNKA